MTMTAWETTQLCFYFIMHYLLTAGLLHFEIYIDTSVSDVTLQLMDFGRVNVGEGSELAELVRG